MMELLKLTEKLTGKTIWVNLAYVVYIQELDEGGMNLTLSMGEVVMHKAVKENIADVLDIAVTTSSPEPVM